MFIDDAKLSTFPPTTNWPREEALALGTQKLRDAVPAIKAPCKPEVIKGLVQGGTLGVDCGGAWLLWECEEGLFNPEQSSIHSTYNIMSQAIQHTIIMAVRMDVHVRIH